LPNRNECFMGCQPVDSDWDTERFYIVAFPELTIYGHSVDRYTQENYKEDWPSITRQRLYGNEWGCWHSTACRDGEIGIQPLDICMRVPGAVFQDARKSDWPETTFITTPDPVARVFASDGAGGMTEIWNSQEGDM
jgi:hypothetical protein